MAETLKVEIWSDVMCPFCYIGKRQFEAALAEFPERGRVEVTWRSFQLDPEMRAQPGRTIDEYLAARKGLAVEQTKQMHERLTQNAAQYGLDYRFDRVVVNNSYAAHRLIQAAKAAGRGEELEEALFHAYFTEGRDIGDRAVLADLARIAGLDAAVADDAWDDPEGRWASRVDGDIAEAQELGTTGVPFFVFQRQYGVTGAQGTETFRKVLAKLSQDFPA